MTLDPGDLAAVILAQERILNLLTCKFRFIQNEVKTSLAQQPYQIQATMAQYQKQLSCGFCHMRSSEQELLAALNSYLGPQLRAITII